MEERQEGITQVPWSTRDVWLGLISLILWWFVVGTISVLLGESEIDVNAGIFVGLAEALLLIPVWWLALHRYGVGWAALGLRPFQSETLGVGCVLLMLSFAVNFIWSAILSVFDLQAQPDLVPIFSELASPIWLLLSGVIVAPVVEELFFRGFVFAGFRKRYGWKSAAVISSALFGLIHLQPAAFVPIFILGFFFAYLYHRSNSLWPPILMHVATNGLALGAAYAAANL
jgi:membrane protease YdiL (CAAX protease family)